MELGTFCACARAGLAAQAAGSCGLRSRAACPPKRRADYKSHEAMRPSGSRPRVRRGYHVRVSSDPGRTPPAGYHKLSRTQPLEKSQ